MSRSAVSGEHLAMCRPLAVGQVSIEPIQQAVQHLHRLKILNALFLMLSKAGFKPSLRGEEAEELGVIVGNFHVSLTLTKIEQRTRPAKTGHLPWLALGKQQTSWRHAQRVTTSHCLACPPFHRAADAAQAAAPRQAWRKPAR